MVNLLKILISSNAEAWHAYERLPRDVESIITWGFEIPVVRVNHLTLGKTEKYLCALEGINNEADFDTTDRSLLGMLHIGYPQNVIFVGAELPSHIVNYVLAHELGHFIADILYVKQLWQSSFPEQKNAVERAFAWETIDHHLEFHALIKGLPPRPQSIIRRDHNMAHETTNREAQADLFARELLAPWDFVLPLFKPSEQYAFAILLRDLYGIPFRIGKQYHEDLSFHLTPQPSTLSRLFSPIVP